jgi:hypothetical protein
MKRSQTLSAQFVLSSGVALVLLASGLFLFFALGYRGLSFIQPGFWIFWITLSFLGCLPFFAIATFLLLLSRANSSLLCTIAAGYGVLLSYPLAQMVMSMDV